MGLSGLLSGAVLFGVVGLIAQLYATIFPTWLITRTELHNKLCWHGDGLFQIDSCWGEDIPEMNMQCQPVHRTRSSHLAYCSSSNDVANPMDLAPGTDDFRAKMCTATTVAKVTSITSLVFGILALGFAYASWQGTESIRGFITTTILRTPPPPSTTRINDDAEQNVLRNEVRVVTASTIFSILASICSATTFFTIYLSPLFSTEHVYEISKNNKVPFPKPQFGCLFQSPLRAKSLADVVNSSPLECLFGGPAYATGAIGFVAWAFAALHFALMLKGTRKLQFMGIKFPSNEHLANTSLFSQATTATVRKNTGEPISAGSIDPWFASQILFPRTYSLHGAVSRRFEHLPSWQRRCMSMLIPVVTMATAGIFTVMMLMNGAAVQVFIRLSSPLLDQAEVRASVVNKLGLDHKAWHDDVVGQDGHRVIEVIEEVFDFTMLTSIKNFWDGKAYAMAFLTCVFCAVWPYVRVAIHMLLYFIPVSEPHRGRTLTWLDALGKWTLVNHFILCFMGVAFHLLADINVPGLLPGTELLTIKVEVVLSPRLATYLFVVGVLISIILSEIYVYVHRRAKEWEEDRRKEVLDAQNSAGGGGGGEDDHHGITAAPSSRQHTSQRPLLAQPLLENAVATAARRGRVVYHDDEDDVMNQFGGVVSHGDDSHHNTIRRAVFLPTDTPFLDGVGGGNTSRRTSDGDTATLQDTSSVTVMGNSHHTRQVRYHHGIGYEALCDRHHSLVPGGKKYIYTTLAKFLVWICIGLTATTTLAGMLENSIAFTFGGVVGDGLVAERDRHHEYSLLSTGTAIDTDMGAFPQGKTLLTGVFFGTALVGPLLRVCCLTLLWFVPMRPTQQEMWFHVAEVVDSWSALDVYFISTLAATLEIGPLSFTILGGSFPNVEKLVEQVLPKTGGLFVVHEALLDGMYLIFIGVLMEKLLSQFIISQTAVAVAERRAEEELALSRTGFVGNGVPSIREENDLHHELEERPDTLALLSPAARYTSASGMPGLVYSGFPVFVWRFGISAGLMVEVVDGGGGDDGSGAAVQSFLLGP